MSAAARVPAGRSRRAQVWYDCIFELANGETYESPGLYFGDDVELSVSDIRTFGILVKKSRSSDGALVMDTAGRS